mmetsp:Transcript_23611/g.32971  ORF Transcript_23611/g.32971 Transcript_23611/m.32971 type:complete len:119 (-) Transcript_23611:639-995(-)
MEIFVVFLKLLLKRKPVLHTSNALLPGIIVKKVIANKVEASKKPKKTEYKCFVGHNHEVPLQVETSRESGIGEKTEHKDNQRISDSLRLPDHSAFLLATSIYSKFDKECCCKLVAAQN